MDSLHNRRSFLDFDTFLEIYKVIASIIHYPFITLIIIYMTKRWQRCCNIIVTLQQPIIIVVFNWNKIAITLTKYTVERLSTYNR